MSQFHWHVTDSQSFPLFIPGYHEIAENGAYSAEETYSEKDVKEIVAYAAAVSILSTLNFIPSRKTMS
jgi:hexosaminidase